MGVILSIIGAFMLLAIPTFACIVPLYFIQKWSEEKKLERIRSRLAKGLTPFP